jgi:2-hydroxychromene-2-carboxylate isomerase
MSTNLDFYFDFGSPTTYLAYKRLLQLQGQYDLSINYIPILLGGLFKATGNASPVTIPAKGSYMMTHDLPRFSKRYGVDLKFNPHFPVNTLHLMRGAIAAQKQGCFDNYVAALFDAMWQQGKNLGDPEIVASVLNDAGMDATALMSLAQDPEVKTELISNTEGAVARGAFGAPTMFIGEEMYFGQDRMDFIEEALAV